MGDSAVVVESGSAAPYGERMLAGARFRLFTSGCPEELQAAKCVPPIGSREAREHGADEARVQHLLCGAQSFARWRQPDVPHASIGFGARADDVALSLEPVDGNGHRRDRHAHVRRQL